MEGDCIIGINADFDLAKIKNIIKKIQLEKSKIIKIKIKSANGKYSDEVTAELNPDFNDPHEIVIRKTDFVSDRTLAIKADKSSSELNRDLIDYLRIQNRKAVVEIFFDTIP